MCELELNLGEPESNKHKWDQFCRLGEMMGDGLHHESDGKWITREYKRLSKGLIPEVKKVEQERRKLRASATNEKINNMLSTFRCSCGCELKQSRSGSKVAYCTGCNLRYKAGKK